MGDQAFKTLRRFHSAVSATQVFLKSQEKASLEDGLGTLIHWLREIRTARARCYLVGNGGSNSVAGHIANDLWKTQAIAAQTFSDGATLTCASNDFGFEHVFSEPLKQFARKGDLLIAISSSGNSPNILNAVKTAGEMGLRCVTFSGFKQTNSLKELGDLNFHVPEESYGIVETAHLLLLHSVIDELGLE